jgi:hypothetical protein
MTSADPKNLPTGMPNQAMQFRGFQKSWFKDIDNSIISIIFKLPTGLADWVRNMITNCERIPRTISASSLNIKWNGRAQPHLAQKMQMADRLIRASFNSTTVALSMISGYYFQISSQIVMRCSPIRPLDSDLEWCEF